MILCIRRAAQRESSGARHVRILARPWLALGKLHSSIDTIARFQSSVDAIAAIEQDGYLGRGRMGKASMQASGSCLTLSHHSCTADGRALQLFKLLASGRPDSTEVGCGARVKAYESTQFIIGHTSRYEMV